MRPERAIKTLKTARILTRVVWVAPYPFRYMYGRYFQRYVSYNSFDLFTAKGIIFTRLQKGI